MALHSSTLAWKIPWTEEPGGLQSMGSLRVRHDWATSLSLFTFMHWRRKWQPTPVFLPGESQGRGSLVGCSPWGRRVGHDWSNLAAAAANLNYTSRVREVRAGRERHWTNSLPWVRSECSARLDLGRTARIPFGSARMLSPLCYSTLIYTLKHKLIQIYLIGGGCD